MTFFFSYLTENLPASGDRNINGNTSIAEAIAIIVDSLTVVIHLMLIKQTSHFKRLSLNTVRKFIEKRGNQLVFFISACLIV
jgi:hypothetical protein